MEEMNKNTLDVAVSASPRQDIAQVEGNKLPSPDKNDNVGTQDEPLTTEEFHELIEANTAKLNKLRMDYANRMSDLHDKYNDELDDILAVEHHATDELRNARMAYENAKVQYELKLRELIKQRTEAGRRHNVGKAEAKSYWTTENEKIQSERNRIFKRYRDSGGYFRKKPKDCCTQVGKETRKEE
jgi:hypothetical protein|nr:MAG TPA: hypothetical protein [Caudoviricetes sp.]